MLVVGLAPYACLICQQPPTKRDGYDRRGRQRYTCRPRRRDFTQLSGSAFSGYGWPAEVILAGMRWYLSYPLSARQVAELLAERGIDVPARRVVKGWVLEPDQVISDHHQHYVKAVKGALPGATHIRTGLHRRRGETTKSIERSPVAIRDRLRCWMPAADQGARAHSRSKLDPRVSRGLRFAGRGD